MKKMIVLILIPLLLWGCSRSKTPTGPMCRVVTQIQVAATVDGQTFEQIHTDSRKMESVLCYLRLLEIGNPVDIDPDSFRSNYYEITLSYSDGQRSTYRQLHDAYLQIDNGSWLSVRAAKIELLFP